MDENTRKEICSFDLPNPFRPRTVVDFAVCSGKEGLAEALGEINSNGFVFLCATQSADEYTVFFWRHLT